MTRRWYLPACATALATLLLCSAMAAEAADYPSRGMTMAAVVKAFGQPRSKSKPVGLPPITHWVYDGFVVYFDKGHVIFHINGDEKAATAVTSSKKTAKAHTPSHPAAPMAAAVAEPLPAAAAATLAAAPVAAAAVASSPAPAAAASEPAVAPTRNYLGPEQNNSAQQASSHPPAPMVTSSHHVIMNSDANSSEPSVKAVKPLAALRSGLIHIFVEDKAWYAGLAGGIGNFGDHATLECNDALHQNSLAGSCSGPQNSPAFKLYAGYNLAPLLAVEGGFTEIGSGSYTSSGSQNYSIGRATAEQINSTISSRALNADIMVNFHPAKEAITIGVKVGGYMAYNSISSTTTSAHVTAQDNISHTFYNASSYLGFSTSYDLTKTMAVQLEWNRFRNLGIANSRASGDVDLLLAGVYFHF